MKNIEPVNNNLTELLNDIRPRPVRFVYLNSLVFTIARYFSSEQERKKAILQNLNDKVVREGWLDNAAPPRSRRRWNQQAHLDSVALNCQPVMNDSCLADLSVQGQAINLAQVDTPRRSQWAEGPRGTIINVLEQANVYDHTMNSTANTATSAISVKALANRVNPDRKNETYVVRSVTPVASSSPIVQKPIETDLVVEDFTRTQTSPMAKAANST